MTTKIYPPVGGTKVKKGKEDAVVQLRIRVRAYENKILDASVKQIIDTALRYDAKIVGPIPLPTEITSPIEPFLAILSRFALKTNRFNNKS